ncbi:hypothetical protein NUSPORA_00751 [Nucleospora cyclopteri]
MIKEIKHLKIPIFIFFKSMKKAFCAYLNKNYQHLNNSFKLKQLNTFYNLLNFNFCLKQLIDIIKLKNCFSYFKYD